MSVADRCKSCSAPLRWVKTEKGRMMPLDPDPVDGGNVSVGEDGVGRVVAPLPGQSLWVSHFTTCPQAGTHRKAARKQMNLL